MKRIACLLMILLVQSQLAWCATWYVRKDGGTRYSAGHTGGQCDGQADVAYPGKGTKQHCAFGDVRWLYDAQDGKPRVWVIAGGDTVIIRDGPWRIGHDQGATNNDVWCKNGNDNNQTCYIPAPPAGTAAQHTVIEGENCISECPDPTGIGPDVTKITELYGGFGLFHVLDLNSTSFVDFKGLGLTRHSQCIQHGQPPLPSSCSQNGNFPADDFAIDGIATFTGLHDVLFQDLYVHGFTNRGVIGPIGGTITYQRVRLSYNGMAGIDFDDGNADPSINNPTWNFLYSMIEYSGCNQAYPGTGAATCYGQSNGGYGDGMGAPSGTALNINFDHSITRYNTQDGIDPGHIDIGTSTLAITNSTFYGNNGQQLKWGYNFASATVTGNTVIGNCLRISAPLADNAAAYNANLGDFCRAGSTLSWNYRDGQTVNFSSNTIVSYGPGLFTLGCSTAGGCPNAHTTFQRNIVLGYDNPATYNLGGEAGGPSGFYCQDNTRVVNGGATQTDCKNMGVFTRASNVFFGVRSFTCLATEKCADPKFVGEPKGSGATFNVAQLDGFNTALQFGSPATGFGAPAQIIGTASTDVASTPPPPVVPPPVVPALPVVPPPAQAGTWFTVIPAEKQAQTLAVSVPAGTTYRFGDTKNNKWCTPVTVSAATTVSDWDAGPEDCDPGTPKEMDILETSAALAVTLIDSSVTPAVSTPKSVPARPLATAHKAKYLHI
jgi:hypothetical protein